MCIGDWRIGRLIRHKITSYTTLLASPVTVNASPHRIGVNIAITAAVPSGVTRVDISIDGIKTFMLTSGIQFIHYDAYYYGDLPNQAFSLAAAADTTVVAVIEWFLPEDVIQSALESIRSEYKLR